jgi:hypothetical protein
VDPAIRFIGPGRAVPPGGSAFGGPRSGRRGMGRFPRTRTRSGRSGPAWIRSPPRGGLGDRAEERDRRRILRAARSMVCPHIPFCGSGEVAESHGRSRSLPAMAMSLWGGGPAPPDRGGSSIAFGSGARNADYPVRRETLVPSALSPSRRCQSKFAPESDHAQAMYRSPIDDQHAKRRRIRLRSGPAIAPELPGRQGAAA